MAIFAIAKIKSRLSRPVSLLVVDISDRDIALLGESLKLFLGNIDDTEVH